MGCTASKNIEMELLKLRDENQKLKDKLNNVDAEPAAEWGVAGWVNSLALTEVVAEALKEPAGTDPFKHVLSLSLADLVSKLEAVKLSGLAAPLWSAIEKLRGQGAATGSALNSKFAAEGDALKGEMGFGGIELFYGGLEKLIGPPIMVDSSLFKAMEREHCEKKDAVLPFATSNNIKGATSRLEWEFVVDPVVADQDGRYAERGGDFRTVHREWCRRAEPLSVYEKKMADEVNPLLIQAGQAPLTLEELVAGRMYTGPMYEKYNSVLRFFSARGADGAVRLEYASMEEVPFLQKKCGSLNLGEWAVTVAGGGEPAAVRWAWHNQYATTIHAINSVIVKLSPLTRITPLYRGWTGATLPQAFFKPDALGFRGGVEYGFSSTTTDRTQAVHYADGKASTVLELEMGMVDRGADISWLSQYPHEKETLLPPLMGLQVRSTGVEGSTLVVQSSFSINLMTPTIEQVLGRHKKILEDLCERLVESLQYDIARDAAGWANLIQLSGDADLPAKSLDRLRASCGMICTPEAAVFNDSAVLGDSISQAISAKQASDGPAGWRELMDALPKMAEEVRSWEALRDANGLIDLHKKDLTDATIFAIVLIASSSPSAFDQVTALHLYGNKMGDFGFALLAEAFSRSAFSKLEDLRLNGNRCISSGAFAMARAVQDGALPALKRFDVGGNPLQKAARGALQAACAQRGGIEFF